MKDRNASTRTRDAILAAARDAVAVDGTFTINGVAARAGVTRQAIHYHFGGARGLREALEPGTDRIPDETPTRERLVEAAIRVLNRPAAGAITIEAIAAEAGLTKGAVYHHFADRRELLAAVAPRVSPVEELTALIPLVEELPIREALIALATTYYRAMETRVELVRHLIVNTAADPALADLVVREFSRGGPVIIGWLMRRIAAGDLAPIDPAFALQAIFGPVFLRIVLGGPYLGALQQVGLRPATSAPEAYVDMLLAGLAPKPHGR